MATKLFSKSLVGLAIAAAEIRIDEGWQAANRNGRAAMTRKTYCGNLLWQSGLTLLAPRQRHAPSYFSSARLGATRLRLPRIQHQMYSQSASQSSTTVAK